jgi:aspartate/glutamate racemase
VHRIIYDELCLGVVLDESRQLYREVIERLVRSGAEGIVLGCTEIELLVSQKDSSVPVFPHHPASCASSRRRVARRSLKRSRQAEHERR